MTFWWYGMVSCAVVVSAEDEDQYNDMYLEADLSLSCSSSWYLFGVTWACIMIVVYPVGVPLLYFKLLWSRKEEILSRHDATKKSLDDQIIKVKTEKTSTRLVSFLYDSYKPRHWYFEIIETSRRLMLTAILSVISAGSSLQIIVAILFALAYLEIYGSECLLQF